MFRLFCFVLGRLNLYPVYLTSIIIVLIILIITSLCFAFYNRKKTCSYIVCLCIYQFQRQSKHLPKYLFYIYPSIYLEGCHPLNASLSCIFRPWCVTLDSILPGIHCQTIIELFPGILSLHSFHTWFQGIHRFHVKL